MQRAAFAWFQVINPNDRCTGRGIWIKEISRCLSYQDDGDQMLLATTTLMYDQGCLLMSLSHSSNGITTLIFI